MQYIIEILEDFINNRVDNHFEWFKIVSDELNGLEVKYFLPEHRRKFIYTKRRFISLAHIHCYSNNSYDSQMVRELIEMLKKYGVHNSDFSLMKFTFLSDAELANIIKRDYAELNNILLPEGAWKSCVILAGSILEAVLFDVLSSDKYNAQALKSKYVPKEKSGNMKMDNWKLYDLIKVANDIKVLPNDKVNVIDQALRQYRNFVHPKKEIRMQFECTEAEALIAKGALDSVCNYLEKN